MADIVSLPGIYRADMIEDCDPRTVLVSALDAGLKDVVVIGRSLSGSIEVFSSQSDADQSIGLMMRGVAYLSTAEQVDEPEIGGA